MKYYLQIKNNEPILYEGDNVISEGIKVNLSQLSDEVKKAIGWVDVEALFVEHIGECSYNEDSNCDYNYKIGFAAGFKAAQSLNERRFTEEDMYALKDLLSQSSPLMFETYTRKFIRERHLFECEIETEERKQFCGRDNDGDIIYDIITSPRIENNSITVLKVRL